MLEHQKQWWRPRKHAGDVYYDDMLPPPAAVTTAVSPQIRSCEAHLPTQPGAGCRARHALINIMVVIALGCFPAVASAARYKPALAKRI
jgi:hypothetical protein